MHSSSTRARDSALLTSTAARLGVVGGALALLWLAVLWARA